MYVSEEDQDTEGVLNDGGNWAGGKRDKGLTI